MPGTYRGYHISYDPPPIPWHGGDWQFWADDYDGGRERLTLDIDV